MNITWLKLSVDIFSDAKIRKIRRLPDGDQMCLVWLGILCMAMKSCRPGLILICDDMPANAEDISDFVDIPCAIVEKAISAFEKLGMVRYANGGAIDVIKFSEHQQLDKIEAAKEAARVRMLEYRRRINPDLKPRKSRKNTDKNEKQPSANVTRTLLERDAIDLDVKVQSKEDEIEKGKAPAAVPLLVQSTEISTNENTPTESHPNPKQSLVPGAAKSKTDGDLLWDSLYAKDKSIGMLPLDSDAGGKVIYFKQGKVKAESIVKEDGLQAALEVFKFAYGNKYCQPVRIGYYKTYKARYMAEHGGTGETPDQVNERVARELEAKWANEAKKELT